MQKKLFFNKIIREILHNQNRNQLLRKRLKKRQEYFQKKVKINNRKMKIKQAKQKSRFPSNDIYLQIVHFD